MPKVVREDIDNLNATLTIKLDKGDYKPKFDSELGKYRKQAHMKGFRKGRTPLSVVKKMYGKAVLGEVINEMLQKHLFDYLNEEKIDILGQPIPAKDQEQVDLDPKDMGDYEFKFDLGIAPEFEIKGLDKKNKFEKLVVKPKKAMIDTELENAQKRFGERTFPEEDILDNDIIKFSAKELDGKKPKEEGIASEFSILVSNIGDSKLQKKVLKMKNGDVLTTDITKLEKDKDDKYIRKYFLNLEDGDEREYNKDFELTIEEVSRIAPAELNQEFFDKMFGEGEVSSEKEAREKLSENIVNHYSSQADALLYRDFQDNLMEKNPLELPDAFLKRWILATNENATEEVLEKEYEYFAKNLQWTLIKNKLAKQFEIEVSQEEIIEGLKNRIRAYFGGGPYASEELVESMVGRLAEDQKQTEQVYEEILSDKLSSSIAEAVSVKDKSIDIEAFEKKIQEAQAQAAAAQAPATEEEE